MRLKLKRTTCVLWWLDVAAQRFSNLTPEGRYSHRGQRLGYRTVIEGKFESAKSEVIATMFGNKLTGLHRMI